MKHFPELIEQLVTEIDAVASSERTGVPTAVAVVAPRVRT
jgi:hypothetical protein